MSFFKITNESKFYLNYVFENVKASIFILKHVWGIKNQIFMTDNYSFQQIFHSLSGVRLCCVRPRQSLHMLKHFQSTHWVPSSQCTFSLLEAHDNLFYVKKGMLINKVNYKISFQVQCQISNIIRYWCTKYLRDVPQNHIHFFIF